VPTLQQAAALRRRRRAAIERRATTAALRLWARVDPADISTTWTRQLAEVLMLLTAAQAAAATGADQYVDTALAAQGWDGAAAGQVSPAGFAGDASDGRDLLSLLAEPAIAVKVGLGRGWPTGRAMAYGQASLARITSTQVADAGRVADGVAIAARPTTYGSVRVVSAGACARCIVLSGRHYRWSEGFLRHPHCHCTMAPLANSEGRDSPEPRELFDRLTGEQQDKTFGRAGAQAIRDGADLDQVVNARRGMYTAGGRLLTHEGTTRRGLAGRRLEAAGARTTRTPGQRNRRITAARLTPEQIYREAAGDRDDAIRLLRRFGYLT
jgi:hypothetical protein